MCDRYGGYDSVLDPKVFPQRVSAACAAHARRKFDELAGQRAAVVMSLVQSAKLNGLEPWAYLRDVLDRLPTHLNSRIDDLLPPSLAASANHGLIRGA